MVKECDECLIHTFAVHVYKDPGTIELSQHILSDEREGWTVMFIRLFLSLSQIFPNADLRLLKHCVSVRDKLLQKKFDEHKVTL